MGEHKEYSQDLQFNTTQVTFSSLFFVSWHLKGPYCIPASRSFVKSPSGSYLTRQGERM